jgi:hypothetical protein
MTKHVAVPPPPDDELVVPDHRAPISVQRELGAAC